MTQPHEPPRYFEKQISLNFLNSGWIGSKMVAAVHGNPLSLVLRLLSVAAAP
jgi:hypothetical protein